MEWAFHPAAEEFPLMDEARLEDLMADIKLSGLRIPIILCEGKILDGRNRYLACKKLNLEPKTENFDGDPWAYVWSLNGERRDLGADQRYLIWKKCNENSLVWQQEQERIREEANKRRSEATTGLPYAAKGEERKPEKVVGQIVPPPSKKEHKTRKGKAKSSKTNAGAVKRGDTLSKKRPDLAEKVRKGEMKSTEAHRIMKREEITKTLNSIENIQNKALLGQYDVIVIDPPWPIQKIERDERPNQVNLDYPTMTIEEIEKIDIPCSENCHIWLWTTHKYLPIAFKLLETWKLKYICTFVWHKTGGFQPFDLPQYNCEFVLYSHRGSPKFIDTKNFPVCFSGSRKKHSEKPQEFYEVVSRVTAGRRLDMFNRRKMDNFETWGKESQ